jgi:hypothetical protein
LTKHIAVPKAQTPTANGNWDDLGNTAANSLTEKGPFGQKQGSEASAIAAGLGALHPPDIVIADLPRLHLATPGVKRCGLRPAGAPVTKPGCRFDNAAPSGELSKQVAEVLRDWLPNLLQFVEPWMSKHDIESGAVWFDEISKELSDTGVGVLCLTPENLEAPWVLFEAGALFKGLTKNRVCPLLIGLRATDEKPPLSQLNLTVADREGMLSMMKTINAQAEEKKLPDDRLQKAFDKWWDEFDGKFKNFVAEILEIVRSIQGILGSVLSAAER